MGVLKNSSGSLQHDHNYDQRAKAITASESTTISFIPCQSVARKSFLDRCVQNIKYKFSLAPKLPSICINQKCLMRVGSYTLSSH